MPKVKLTYKNGKWYRNGVEIKNPRTYTFIDQNGKRVTGLHNYKPKTPGLDLIKGWMQDRIKQYDKSMQSQRNSSFPAGDKIISALDVPVNMLDTIAINTGRSGTNIKDNLGFLPFSRPEWNTDIYDSGMIKNQSLIPSQVTFNDYPEQTYLTQQMQKFNQGPKAVQLIRQERQAQNDLASGEYAKFIGSQPKINNSPDFLQNSYIRFANLPDDRYVLDDWLTAGDIRLNGEGFFNQPDVQEWWNNEGKKYYNKGLKERFK